MIACSSARLLAMRTLSVPPGFAALRSRPSHTRANNTLAAGVAMMSEAEWTATMETISPGDVVFLLVSRAGKPKTLKFQLVRVKERGSARRARLQKRAGKKRRICAKRWPCQNQKQKTHKLTFQGAEGYDATQTKALVTLAQREIRTQTQINLGGSAQYVDASIDHLVRDTTSVQRAAAACKAQSAAPHSRRHCHRITPRPHPRRVRLWRLRRRRRTSSILPREERARRTRTTTTMPIPIRKRLRGLLLPLPRKMEFRPLEV